MPRKPSIYHGAYGPSGPTGTTRADEPPGGSGSGGTPRAMSSLRVLHYGPDEAAPYTRTWDADNFRRNGTVTITIYDSNGNATTPASGTVIDVRNEQNTLQEGKHFTHSNGVITFLDPEGVNYGYHPIGTDRIEVRVYTT